MLNITNSLNSTETLDLDIPATVVADNAALIAAIAAATGKAVTRATVGKGYTDPTSKARATVWVWFAKPVAEKPAQAPKQAAAKVAKPAKKVAVKAAPQARKMSELSRRENDAITRAANASGLSRRQVAERLGITA